MAKINVPEVALGSADALFSYPDAVIWHGKSVLHSISTCSMMEPGVCFFVARYGRKWRRKQ